MLFMGRSGASSVALGSLRDSSSAATEPATVPLKSRNAACAVSQGRKSCGDKLAAGSSAVNTWTPCPVLAACKRDVERGTGRIGRSRTLVERNRNVGIAQQAGGDATSCQFTLHPPRQRQHNILLRQRRGDGSSDVVAAVRRIDQHQEAWRSRLPWLGRWVLRWSRRRMPVELPGLPAAEQERR